MNMLVTGGAGFIGSNLVDRLIDLGHDVVVVDNLSTGKKENLNNKCKFINADINDPEITKIFKNIDIVFHLAALARVQPSIDDPVYYDNVNVNGTVNILKASVDNKVKRFIYSASSSAYGDTENMPIKETDPADPISPYAVQKYVGEVYCKMFSKVYGLETVCLRYFNAFGERQSLEGAYALVIGVFTNQLLHGKPMTVRGTGEQRRDFTYVGDIAKANILSFQSKKVGFGEVINIGTGVNYSVNQIADFLKGERIYVDPVTEPFETLADISLAKELIDWEPSVKFSDWVVEYREKMLAK